MFTSSASAFQAFSHTHISIFFPELTLPTDGNPFIKHILLDPFKSIVGPFAHRLYKSFNFATHYSIQAHRISTHGCIGILFNATIAWRSVL